MIPLTIYPRAEGMAEGVDMARLVEAKAHLKVGALASGTVTGKPTVSFFFELPDGTPVFAQTTLALFLTAADAFKAVHGDPRT